jgi:hypothetical protein
MSSRDRVKDKAAGFKGQKSAFPIESYGIDSAEQIQNFFLHHKQLNKINGCTLYGEASLAAAGGILSLHVFKDVLISQRDKTLSFNLYTPIWATNVFTDVITLTLGQKLFSAFYRDKLFLTNTRDVFFIPYQDSNGLSIGSTMLSLGLDCPQTAMDSLSFSAADAGNVNNTDHYYMLALYDQLTNTESPCGGACPTVDGVVELSPNGFLGPQPTLLAAPGAARKVRFAAAALKSYVTTAMALSGNRASHFVVYRSGPKVNGLFNSFFRVPLKDGGTYDGSVLIPISALAGIDPPGPLGSVGDFIDNTADADLPAVSPPDNNSPPPTPVRMLNALTTAKAITIGVPPPPEAWALGDYSGFRHMRFFRDQLFGVGAHSYGMTVSQNISLGADINQKVTGRISQFRDLLHGSEVYQPDYWPYRWEVGKGDGQETIGLGVLGDVALLIFKEGSAYYLSGSSPDNFVVRIMDTQRGCVHQGSIQETPLGVITLDRSGFVLWNKIGQGTPLSDSIHDQIEEILFRYASTIYSSYDSKLKLYRCSVVVAGSQTPNMTFTLDLDSGDWTTEAGMEGLSRVQFSVNSNNITSIIAQETGVDSQLDVGKIYDFVGSKNNGRIFDYSSNVNVLNQVGGAIEAIWTSGTINFGDDQHQKRMNWVYLRAKSFGGWKVDIEVIPDYDEARKYVLRNWDVTASQSEWYSSDIATDGSLLWDSGTGTGDGGVWASAGQGRQVSKIPIKCIGKTFQIRIIHKDTTANNYAFAIESVSAEGCLLGR